MKFLKELQSILRDPAKTCQSLLLERQADYADGDEGNAEPLARRVALAKKTEREDGDEHKAEFIYRRDIRCGADLKPAKIADPRRTGR